MVDLSKQFGLPISLSAKDRLVFDYPKLETRLAIRKASDMKEVISDYHPDMADQELYRMYRDIAYEDDREKFVADNLRYDITVMAPLTLGEEFNKTKGHYHPKVLSKKINYPEVYEVIYGQAWYLIQKPKNRDYSAIEQNYLVRVDEGEKVVIPPGFGHVTINPNISNPLVMSNWVSRAFKSKYEQYLKFKGASYYILESSGSDYEEKINPNYSQVPDLKPLRPVDLPEFGLLSDRPAYEIGKSDINRLDFLNKPGKYQLSIDKLFKNE